METYRGTLLFIMGLDCCLNHSVTMLGVGDFTMLLINGLINSVARRWGWRWRRTAVKGSLNVNH